MPLPQRPAGRFCYLVIVEPHLYFAASDWGKMAAMIVQGIARPSDPKTASYALNDPKVTRRAFFSPYSGPVSAQEFARPLGLGVFKSCVYVYGHFDRFVLYKFLDKVSGHRPQLANSLRPP